MSSQAKADVDGPSELGIFGLSAFQAKDLAKAKWTQIGTATQNGQGYLDLKFDCWPTNIVQIQVRPLDRPPAVD